MKYIDYLTDKTPATKNRVNTDTLFQLEAGAYDFSGPIDKYIRFIENVQLMDSNMWRVFFEQFDGSYPDSADMGWRGEYWGKMMRGACFTYRYTKNPELYKILETAVTGLVANIEKSKRLSTYSPEDEFTSWDIWCRKYCILGLEYFLEISDNTILCLNVLEKARHQLDYIIEHIGDGDGQIPITQTSNRMQALNSSSILEPVVRMYNLTGDQKYLDFATHIVNCGGASQQNVFELAYERKIYPYEYSCTKAYEMMSCFEGLLEYYRVTGIEKWRIAVENFLEMILETDFTIIGSSACNHEYFNNATVQQTNTDITEGMQETCVTITLMKLCYQVLCLNGDSKLMDKLEQTIYNALMGSVNTEMVDRNGGFPFDSYSPSFARNRGIGIGGLRFMKGGYIYGCCACIGSAGTGLMALCSYMARRDGIAVNMFTSGSVKFKTPDMCEAQIFVRTDYPVGRCFNMQVVTDSEERFVVAIRIPEWSKNTKVTVNGEIVKAVAGEYLELNRVWKKTDKVSIVFDGRARVIKPQGVPENPDSKRFAAIMYGPLVMARDARLGENIEERVELDVDSDGYTTLLPSAYADFDCIAQFAVPTKDGGIFHVVDYGSAGKTLDDESKTTAWIYTK